MAVKSYDARTIESYYLQLMILKIYTLKGYMNALEHNAQIGETTNKHHTVTISKQKKPVFF